MLFYFSSLPVKSTTSSNGMGMCSMAADWTSSLVFIDNMTADKRRINSKSFKAIFCSDLCFKTPISESVWPNLSPDLTWI